MLLYMRKTSCRQRWKEVGKGEKEGGRKREQWWLRGETGP